MKAQKYLSLASCLTDLDAHILSVQHVCGGGTGLLSVRSDGGGLCNDGGRSVGGKLLRETKKSCGRDGFIAVL